MTGEVESAQALPFQEYPASQPNLHVPATPAYAQELSADCVEAGYAAALAGTVPWQAFGTHVKALATYPEAVQDTVTLSVEGTTVPSLQRTGSVVESVPTVVPLAFAIGSDTFQGSIRDSAWLSGGMA